KSAGPVPALRLPPPRTQAQDARMARVPAPSVLATLIALCCACWLAPAAAAEGVTLYRCTDARGKVALRDSPCPQGQKQTTRELVRIVDPPPARRLEPVRVTTPASPPPQPPTTIVINTPRPMYECVTPDGQRYSSESPEGNPRWVPLWTLDYPVLAERRVVAPGGGSLRYRDGHVDAHWRSGTSHRRVVPTIAAYGAGTWIRDACRALPQQETCARLRDRRDEVRRAFFNGQPSERERLSLEERGINARLASDCGGS
ncbi:MAG TPA: DUF4124 domain-containing protein, partial [Xanthomonadaceae bacterium]|nr:DUF4124 domain-containing protein [Xanthomonadaceae bacterium]